MDFQELLLDQVLHRLVHRGFALLKTLTTSGTATEHTHLSAASTADTHLDAVVGGQVQQVAVSSGLRHLTEVRVESSLTESAGEARATDGGRAGNKRHTVQVYSTTG